MSEFTNALETLSDEALLLIDDVIEFRIQDIDGPELPGDELLFDVLHAVVDEGENRGGPRFWNPGFRRSAATTLAHRVDRDRFVDVPF